MDKGQLVKLVNWPLTHQLNSSILRRGLFAFGQQFPNGNGPNRQQKKAGISNEKEDPSIEQLGSHRFECDGSVRSCEGERDVKVYKLYRP